MWGAACPGLHRLLLTSTCNSTTFTFVTPLQISVWRFIWKPGREMLELEIHSCNNVLVKHSHLSSSILFESDLTFSIMMGKDGFNSLFISQCFALLLHPWCFCFKSLGICGLSLVIVWLLEILFSYYNIAMVTHHNRWQKITKKENLQAAQYPNWSEK